MTNQDRGDARLAALRALHAEVDREATRIAAAQADRIRCARGCSGCCQDDLTVTSVEAARIRESHPRLLREGEPHAVGACAFLDEEGACRIYAERPLVCRTQGLPLRVIFEDESDSLEERRDICPLNLPGGPPLDALPESECWLVGPHELRLAELEAEFAAGGEPDAGSGARRVALRSLFDRTAAPRDAAASSRGRP